MRRRCRASRSVLAVLHDRLAVDQQHLSDHVACPAQLKLPELMAEHRDRMAADRLVDFWTEQASQRRHEAQCREVRAHHLMARLRPRSGESA